MNHDHESVGGGLPGKPPAAIGFPWLLMLRWGAVACQILLILAVRFLFDIQVPLVVVSAIIAFEAASNLFFTYLLRRRAVISEELLAVVMFLDVILLTMLLFFTGGPMNPFTFLYLVHIVIGAILLRPPLAWGLMLFTVVCYAGFFFSDSGLTGYQGRETAVVECIDAFQATAVLQQHMRMHLQGMWVAFAITAFFIVFFVGRIQTALQEHQKLLVNLEEERMRSERLASLATLAAGAAHEFSTPLSTIAVAAGEMVHTLKSGGAASPELIDDAVLIRNQVDRCKEILFQMAADAGEHRGEAVEEFEIAGFCEMLANGFGGEFDCTVNCHDKAAGFRVRMPPRLTSRIIRGLLKNALDASPAAAVIDLLWYTDEQRLYVEVADRGSGMTEETRERAAEPFFTTKQPGKGLGLGLYLARTVAERFGGGLEIRSTVGGGSRVILSFARREIEAPGK